MTRTGQQQYQGSTQHSIPTTIIGERKKEVFYEQHQEL